MRPPQLLILNMMWILPIVGYAGVVLCLVFLTLAIGMSLSPSILNSTAWLMILYPENSVRTILPLRVGRRAYGAHKEITQASNIRNNSRADIARAYR